MLVALALTGFLLFGMPGVLFLAGYLVKRYTKDRPIRANPLAGKAKRTRARPIYGEFVGKRGKPIYTERA